MTAVGRVKLKWKCGFTRIMLNANGLQASEGVKLILMIFCLRMKWCNILLY